MRQRKIQMTPQRQAALEAVLEYLMPAERRDFEEAGQPENHICKRLQEIEAWLEEVTAEA
jgi:hypothetical protein